MQRLRAIGISLGIGLMFCAVGAQTASATETYTSGVAAGVSTFITGQDTSNGVWSDPSGTASCSTVSLSGEAVQKGPASHEITLTPSYSGCTCKGFATCHVATNCHILLTTPTTIEPTKWTLHTPHLVPTSGSSCVVTFTPTGFGVSVCTESVPNQTPTSGHAILTNAGSGSTADMNLVATWEGIHYTGTGGVCSNGETHSDMTFTVNWTLKGYSNSSHATQVGLSAG